MRTLGAALSLAAILASCGGGGDGTPPDAKEKSECDKRGIDPEHGRTGTCLQGAYKITVVNRDEPLEIRGWVVELNRQTTPKALGGGSGAVAHGVFVVFDVTVTSKLNHPASFVVNQFEIDPTVNDAPAFALSLGDNTFRPSFDVAKRFAPDSCLAKQPREIRPGGSKTCEIIFDVTANRAANLSSPEAVGNLLVFPPRTERSGPTRVGTIRLYR